MSRKQRIAVLVSGGGTNLQALIDAQDRGDISNGCIEVVVADRLGAYALERAKSAGIPTYTVERSAMSFENRLLTILKEFDIDVIVLAGFLTILSEAFISSYEGRILNVHPSLIPSFCGKGCYGLKVHRAALDRGVKVTGATVHIVNEIPDGGRILMQKAVEVRPDDSPEALSQRVMEQAEWVILPIAVEKLCFEISNAER